MMSEVNHLAGFSVSKFVTYEGEEMARIVTWDMDIKKSETEETISWAAFPEWFDEWYWGHAS